MKRAAANAAYPGSGAPCEKIPVQRQSMICASFRMELRSKNIIAGNRCGKVTTVVGFTNAVFLMRRTCIETVHEIKPAVIGNSSPERMGMRLTHLVPRNAGVIPSTKGTL